MLDRVVIVGASLAGLRAAETLRAEGFDRTITVVGAEPHLPYDRPPLSKKVLAGEWGPERIVLRKREAFDELELDLRLGTRARSLDLDGRTIALDGGERIPWDGLVIATGAHPRWLPDQPDLAGVVTLRTLEDSLALHELFTTGSPRVVVVGAGFIGAEVAATARGLGLDVTILEAAPVPLWRALGPEMGVACAAIHADHGVRLRLGVRIEGFVGGERVEGVRLADGEVVPADVVVVGIGATPTTDWLEGSGLLLGDGVVCDATLAAGPPGVYAAGDLARWPNHLLGTELRMEHWTNANEQGAVAARNLLRTAAGGFGEPYAAVPFVWSEQYSSRLQFVGHAHPDDEVRVVHGSVEERRFVALYGREGRLTAAVGLDQPKLLMPFRKLLAERATWEQALARAAAS